MPSPYTKYKEYQPAPMLRPYICCYWSAIPFEKQIKEYTYQIIPDGCTDIIIEYDYINQSSTLKYYGLFEDYFKITERFNPGKITFGIRLYPGSSAYFIREKAVDTARKALDLNQLDFPFFKQLHDNIHKVKCVSTMIAFCDQLFSQALKGVYSLSQDPLLINILHQMVRSRGSITIEELTNKDVIGSRRMNRLFEERIGLSPKKFSQVIRFQ